MDPGPLTAKHAKFSEKLQCAACHTGHSSNKISLIKAAAAKTDFTDQCLTCHAFGGPERKAHNTVFAGRKDLKDIACTMCHTEHHGADFDIKKVSDGQCNACHQVNFESFSKGHPEFPQNFSGARRTSVQFDHAAHLNKHFKNPSAAKLAPQTCTACHAIESKEQSRVKTGSFEQNCASCHSSEIKKKELVFFRLPQMEHGMDPKPAVPFESISTEEPTAIMAFLMGIESSDPKLYTEPVQKLLLDMLKNGTAPLSALIDSRTEPGVSAKLLGDLTPEVVKRAAYVWAENQEYESTNPASFHGWYADALELKYKPSGHADLVMQNWIDFAAAAMPKSEDPAEKTRFEAMRKDFLGRTGNAGACTKCHAVSALAGEEKTERLSVDWKIHKTAERIHTHFSHGVHMSLLGDSSDACLKCHAMNPSADYAGSFKGHDSSKFVSNFNTIKKETCLQCHGSEAKTQPGSQIRQDCLLCHSYHVEPRVRKK